MTTSENWADTYPQIETYPELRALQHETVIRDEGGFIYEKDDDENVSECPWFVPGVEDGVAHDDIDLPAQVIYARLPHESFYRTEGT